MGSSIVGALQAPAPLTEAESFQYNQYLNSQDPGTHESVLTPDQIAMENALPMPDALASGAGSAAASPGGGNAGVVAAAGTAQAAVVNAVNDSSAGSQVQAAPIGSGGGIPTFQGIPSISYDNNTGGEIYGVDANGNPIPGTSGGLQGVSVTAQRQGFFTSLLNDVSSGDISDAGELIYNKVGNLLASSDPAHHPSIGQTLYTMFSLASQGPHITGFNQIPGAARAGLQEDLVNSGQGRFLPGALYAGLQVLEPFDTFTGSAAGSLGGAVLGQIAEIPGVNRVLNTDIIPYVSRAGQAALDFAQPVIRPIGNFLADETGAIRNNPDPIDLLTSNPKAHAFERHGGDVTDEQLMTRAYTGVAPDGSVKLNAKGIPIIPPMSSAFYSDDLLVFADQQVRNGGALTQAIANNPGAPFQTVFPADVGDLGADLGRGFLRLGPSKFNPDLQGPLQLVSQLRSVQATYQLNPLTGQYETITIFPSR